MPAGGPPGPRTRRSLSAKADDARPKNHPAQSMSLASALHIALHLIVPLAVALLFFRARWGSAWMWMLAGWLIDADHLLADPVYAPDRCSIGFHPLHTAPAIAVYGAMSLIPQTRLLGIGLGIHIGLDAADCVRTRTQATSLKAAY